MSFCRSTSAARSQHEASTSACAEKRSIVLTTNLTFGEWPTIFPNAACTTALIDRLVHHSEIISIEGKSYRAREAEGARPSRRTPRRHA